MNQYETANNSAAMQRVSIKRFAKIAVVLMAIFAVWVFVEANTNPVQAETLSAPTLSYYTKTHDSISLKWTVVSGAQSYVIYKYSSTNGQYNRVKVVSGGSTVKTTVTGLARDTTYKFVVRAAQTTTGSSVGSASNVLTVSTYNVTTYRITPDMLPINKGMLNYGYYNQYTRQYYLIRSYMELFEKNGSGRLILTAGTYSITNTIYVPSNVFIVFENGAYMKRGTYTGSSLDPSHSLFQLVRPSRSKSVGVYSGYNGEKNITFQGYGNATIDMRHQYNATTIQTGHNQNVTVTGMTFKNIDGGHFIEMDATKNMIVQDCKFESIIGDDVSEGINLDTPDKITKGYTAIWSSYDCTPNYEVLINRCTFSSMGRGVGTHNYSGTKTHNYVTVTNCTFTNMKSYAVGLMNWRYAVVANNKMVGNSTAMANERAGVIGYGVKSCAIKNNTIYSYYRGMLFKTGVGGNTAEINAYGPTYNYFTTQNVSDIKTNHCSSSVPDRRALLFYADGSEVKIVLPLI